MTVFKLSLLQRSFGVRCRWPRFCSNSTSNNDTSSVKDYKTLPGPPQLPFFGSFLHMMRNYKFSEMHHAVRDNSDRYGEIYRDKSFHMKLVVVSTPEATESIFRQEGKYPGRFRFRIWEKVREKHGIPLSMFLSSGPEWLENRRAVDKPLMMLQNVYRYIGPLNETSKDAIKLMVDSQAQNDDLCVAGLKEFLFRWSLESVSAFLYERRLGVLDVRPNTEGMAMISAVQDIFDTTVRMFALPVWLARIAMPFSYRKHSRAWDVVFDVSHKYIIDGLNDLSAARARGEKPAGFLANIVKEDSVMPVKTVEAIVSELMFGGIDTTAYSVLWLLYHLGRNPIAVQKIQQEIRQYVGPTEVPDEKYVRHASYLKACLKESMRLTPIFLNNGRVMEEHDSEIAGFKVLSVLRERYVKYSPGHK